jgi:hypothetical protein
MEVSHLYHEIVVGNMISLENLSIIYICLLDFAQLANTLRTTTDIEKVTNPAEILKSQDIDRVAAPIAPTFSEPVQERSSESG